MDAVIIPNLERTQFGFANDKTIGSIKFHIAGESNPHDLASLEHLFIDINCFVGMEVLDVMKILCTGEDYEACVIEFSKPESRSKRYILECKVRNMASFNLIVTNGAVEGANWHVIRTRH